MKVRLSKEVYDRLSAMATLAGCSIADIVRAAIRQYQEARR